MIWIEIMQFKLLATAELNFELKNFVTQIKKVYAWMLNKKFAWNLKYFS